MSCPAPALPSSPLTHIHTSAHLYTQYYQHGCTTFSMFCLPGPAWPQRLKALDPRPCLLPVRTRTEHWESCPSQRWDLEQSLAWDGPPSPHTLAFLGFSASPVALVLGVLLPAWPLSLMRSPCAQGTNTPTGVTPDTRVRLGRSRTHTRTHTRVNTAASFGSLKNSEPSKAGPPGVRQVCFLGM